MKTNTYEEKIRIEVKAYRDSKGNRTCAKDFPTGRVCVFYRTQRFGCHETCVFAEESGKYSAGMNRRDNGDGSLIPLDNCPIWKDKK